MAGYGLGFGSHRISRQFASLGQNVPPAVLQPSSRWTGTPGSGFGGPLPLDPARATAKPVCRLLTPPNQFYTAELVVGVWAGANHSGSMLDNLGLEKVVVHCEGTRFDIAAPSFYLFVDANGQPRRYLGWWAVLQHDGRHGTAEVYFEAVPKDPAMQRRVIGPYRFMPRPALHDHVLEIAATPPQLAGARYKTLTSALDHLAQVGAQNPLITFTEAYTGDLASASLHPGGAGYTTITATAPVLFRKPGLQAGAGALFRPRVDGLWFKGPNIAFDFRDAAYIYHENPANRAHVFEGVSFTDSGGRYHLVRKGQKQTPYIARNRPFLLECTVEAIQDAANGAELVRGCTLSGGNRDAASGALAVIGCVIKDWSSDAWRAERPALRVQYTGALSSATLELTGGNEAASRVLTARAGGAVAGTFTIANSEAAHAADTNYTIANVVAWLNGLPGWSATLLDDSRRASALSLPGASPLGGPFAPVDARSAPLELVTAFDQHSDLWAPDAASRENVLFVDNLCFDNAVQSLFVGPPQGVADMMVLNNAFHLDAASPDFDKLASQLQHPASHLVVAHNSWANQRVLLRADNGFAPDQRCLIAANVMPALRWEGSAAGAAVIAGNHLFAGAAIPAGSSGTTSGGDMASLFTDPATGGFTPAGALLAGMRPPLLRYDRKGVARAVPAPPGAFADGSGAAPAITSANPSGSYPEGQALAGQLSANKPVSWSVSGPEAALVSLDPQTGAWSLPATDFETRTLYSFTFRATDALGDFAEQAVLIAITDIDEIAPVLTAAQGLATSQTGATLSVSTNEGLGTLFWFVSQSATPPAAAALIAGTGAIASGSRTVTSTGAQQVLLSGLQPQTSYFAHFLHRDGAGNASLVASSAAFATPAPAGGGVAVVSHAVVLNSSATIDPYVAAPFTFSGGAGRVLVAVVAMSQQVAQSINDLSVSANGQAMTRLAGAARSGGGSRPLIGVFVRSGLGAGPVNLTTSLTGGARSASVLLMEVSGLAAANLLSSTTAVEGLAQSYSRSYTPTKAGNLVLGILATRGGNMGPFTADAGMTVVKDVSTGLTATSDHCCLAGWRIAPGTQAVQAGAVTATNPEVLFVAVELNAA